MRPNPRSTSLIPFQSPRLMHLTIPQVLINAVLCAVDYVQLRVTEINGERICNVKKKKKKEKKWGGERVYPRWRLR